MYLKFKVAGHAPLVLMALIISLSLRGENYPNFLLKGTDGKHYDQNQFLDKEFVCIVLYSNHCKISQSFEELIKEISKVLVSEKSILLLVSPNNEKALLPDELAYSDVGDSLKEMRIRSMERDFDFPYLYDGVKQSISNQLSAKSTPHAFLFNKAGKLIYDGRIGDYNEPNNLNKSDLYHTYREAKNNNYINQVNTKVHGTAIKTKKDIFIANEVRRRYSEESVKIRSINQQTLKFFLKYNLGKTTLFYLWSTKDESSRENLLILSEIYKIFRKRGLKLYTINVDKDLKETKLQLEKSQLSASNFILPGNEISPLVRYIPNNTTRVTPLTILFSKEQQTLVSKIGSIDSLMLKRLILKDLKTNSIKDRR
tara:strand:+ start:2384 stop:3490 length:1107 start_codon:yes stop_codon:yes gene_type:complete